MHYINVLLLLLLAYRLAPRTFQLALRGYSVASLPRASRFARARFALRAHENFQKKSMSQSTQNSLKYVKMQKKKFYPFWPITRYARSAKFTKIFEKNKCVSIDSKYSETHRNAKKKFFLPLWHIARSAKREWQSATLPTPCHPQGPKECPCQVSCWLD